MSPLTAIRSRFSFHYRDENDLVEQSFQEIPADDAWQFFLSNIEGNCFYYASELVVQSGVIKLMDRATNPAAQFLEATAQNFTALCDLTNEVSGQTLVLFGECIKEIVSYRLSNARSIGAVELSELPALFDLQIPFFVDDTAFNPIR